MLRALLRVALELLGEDRVLGRRRTARTRPGNGVRGQAIPLDPEEKLGRRADDLERRGPNEEEIRARVHPAQHVGPHHPVEVVATRLEQQTPEALRRVRRVGGEPVLVGDLHLAVFVDDRLAGVREDHVGPLVQRLDAAPQQVAAVEVVVRGPLEQLAAALVEHTVVVRRGADVPGQPEVPDA